MAQKKRSPEPLGMKYEFVMILQGSDLSQSTEPGEDVTVTIRKVSRSKKK